MEWDEWCRADGSSEYAATGLQRLAKSPSKRGLANRLEDTLRNAEFVGRAWARSFA